MILPDGRTIDYTALAEKAAEVDLVTDVTLRDPSTWRLLGKPMERLDIRLNPQANNAMALISR